MNNNNSNKLENCNSCHHCHSCDFCHHCNFCHFCNFCNSCDSCDSCHFCNYCKGLRMSEKMIFCVGEGRWESKGKGYQKNLQIFNTDVTEAEYNKVKNALNAKSYERLFTKTTTYTDAWKEMWDGFKQEDKDFFTSLPHFDKDIFKEITGIDIEEEPEEMTMEEVCKALGRTVKIKK